MTAALKIDLLNWETLAHSGIRFLTGFAILGIGYFYIQQIKLKLALLIIFGLFLADDILDYLRQIQTFTTEHMLYDLYIMTWGALVGYVTGKYYQSLKQPE